MNIVNKATFSIIAVCWHKKYGYGNEETIESNQSGDVFGPYIGEVGGGSCCLVMPSEITCHEELDNKFGFHVSEGNQLNLGNGESGVTVRHHLNDLKLG